MRRLTLHEIHDHPKCPGFLRDLFTDALESIWDFTNSYGPVVGKLLESMEHAGTRELWICVLVLEDRGSGLCGNRG